VAFATILGIVLNAVLPENAKNENPVDAADDADI
jgi:xanthine/uracil permease